MASSSMEHAVPAPIAGLDSDIPAASPLPAAKRLRRGPSHAAAEFPPGPEEYEETHKLAEQMVDRIIAKLATEPGRGVRPELQKEAGLHVVVSTSYSGMGCPEMSCRFLEAALKKHGMNVHFEFFSACEVDKPCQDILMHHKDPPKHIFANLLDRLTETDLATLTRLQNKYIKRLCRKAPSEHMQPGRKSFKQWTGRAEHVKTLGAKFLKEAVSFLQSATFSKGAKYECVVHGAKCMAVPEVKAGSLWVEVGGNTCTPWASAGNRMGWLDPASLPCLAWAAWLNFVRPHHLINECTPRFPEDFWKQMMGEETPVCPVNFSPIDLGMPVARPRQYVHVVLKKRSALSVPLTQENFAKVAFRSLRSYGSLYALAPESLVKEFLDDLAGERMIQPRANGKSYMCQAIMDTADRVRMEGYRTRAQEVGFHPRSELCANVRQSANFFTSLATHVPTLMRNCQVYVFRHERLLMPLEKLACQGFPLFLPPDSEYAGLLGIDEGYLKGLPKRVSSSICGNGMAISAVGSVLLFRDHALRRQASVRDSLGRWVMVDR